MTLEKLATIETILNVSSYSDYYTNSMNNKIKHIALESFSKYSNVEYQYMRIIKLKHSLYILKEINHLVLDALIQLSEKREVYTKILTLYYIDRIKCKKIADLMGVNIRTFFRLKNNALTSLYKIINNSIGIGIVQELILSSYYTSTMYNDILRDLRGKSKTINC